MQNLIFNQGFASSTQQSSTSSFPYYSVGPVDFSQLNFVRTEQVDYYYDTDASGSVHLVSQVTQIYDPTETFAFLIFVTAGFLYCVIKFIKFVRKQGK